ncbi:hypothetical protein NE237_024147 [Protea cynaroides]|uniref:Uncharacterized protein n=1 Tax=Protea cynaroides TaxID=273540 RepID=A0A9Q0HGB8_9MAGN|nr:hypothetical protein NE237_024147 [Protea cynaroides]
MEVVDDRCYDNGVVEMSWCKCKVQMVIRASQVCRLNRCSGASREVKRSCSWGWRFAQQVAVSGLTGVTEGRWMEIDRCVQCMAAGHGSVAKVFTYFAVADKGDLMSPTHHKLALRSFLISATVGDALSALKRSEESYLSIWIYRYYSSLSFKLSFGSIFRSRFRMSSISHGSVMPSLMLPVASLLSGSLLWCPHQQLPLHVPLQEFLLRETH